MAQDLIGKTVEWEAAGRGRGKILRGTVIGIVEPGTTNQEALDALKASLPDLKVRPKYIRFALDTHRTHRLIVLVDIPSKRQIPIRYIYAPNVAEVWPV